MDVKKSTNGGIVAFIPYYFESYNQHNDVVAQAFDESRWIIQLKIVEEKRVGEGNMPINIEKMGAAIGQALLYSVAYKDKYPSQKWNVMPAGLQRLPYHVWPSRFLISARTQTKSCSEATPF